MLENKDVQENEEKVEQEESKEITLPAFLLPVAGGLILDGAYHVGKTILKISIKVGKGILSRTKKQKEDDPELHGFLDEEDSE